MIDSCLASSMKPHVLMMTTSARAGSSVKVKPSRANAPSMTSLSTWFLEQPRLTKPIVIGRVRARAVITVCEAMTRSVEEGGIRVKSDRPHSPLTLLWITRYTHPADSLNVQCWGELMAKAKKKSLREEDIARLKKKVAERKAKAGKVLGDAALRALRKRLKREQRKRRSLAQRLAHAQGKKKEAQPAAATG